MSAREPIVVACAADDLFAMPLAVTVSSVLENHSMDKPIALYILDGDIRAKNKQKIVDSFAPDRIEINWVKPSSAYVEDLYFHAKSNYPISAYYRLLLPEIIPDEYEKVIYLDTDIVLLEDIEKLWTIPMEDYHMLAAVDAANRCMGWPKHLKHLDFEALGVTKEEKYLQSGVLVIDLKKWRSENITEQLIEFVADHPELPYPDMDALNFVLAKKWGELDPRWNQIPVVFSFESWEKSPYTQEQLSNVVNNPYIVHYGSNPKPWDRRCTHPLTSLWYQYVSKTAWAGWEDTLVKHNARLVRRILRRLKKHYKQLSPRNDLSYRGLE